MARRSWRRRAMLIGAVTVALSIGIVFASLPYLQAPTPPHATITTPKSLTVGPGNSTYPNFGAFKLNITNPEYFYVGISVSGSTASFCVMPDYLYEMWAPSYSRTRTPPLPLNDCIVQEQQISQDTLKFLPSGPGIWVVVVLNPSSSEVTVYFSKA